MTLENLARLRIRAELRYTVDMKRLAALLKEELSTENYNELKKYIEEEYKITKKRLDGINQTMKDLI